jgi:hypothetical protein
MRVASEILLAWVWCFLAKVYTCDGEDMHVHHAIYQTLGVLTPSESALACKECDDTDQMHCALDHYNRVDICLKLVIRPC